MSFVDNVPPIKSESSLFKVFMHPKLIRPIYSPVIAQSLGNELLSSISSSRDSVNAIASGLLDRQRRTRHMRPSLTTSSVFASLQSTALSPCRSRTRPYLAQEARQLHAAASLYAGHNRVSRALSRTRLCRTSLMCHPSLCSGPRFGIEKEQQMQQRAPSFRK